MRGAGGVANGDSSDAPSTGIGGRFAPKAGEPIDETGTDGVLRFADSIGSAAGGDGGVGVGGRFVSPPWINGDTRAAELGSAENAGGFGGNAGDAGGGGAGVLGTGGSDENGDGIFGGLLGGLNGADGAGGGGVGPPHAPKVPVPGLVESRFGVGGSEPFTPKSATGGFNGDVRGTRGEETGVAPKMRVYSPGFASGICGAAGGGGVGDAGGAAGGNGCDAAGGSGVDIAGGTCGT